MADTITEAHKTLDPKTAVMWTAGRSLELWAGMKMAGETDRPLERAIAGAVAVQLAITGWMLLHRSNPDAKLPSIDAVQRRDIFGLLSTYVLRSAIVEIGRAHV